MWDASYVNVMLVNSNDVIARSLDRDPRRTLLEVLYQARMTYVRQQVRARIGYCVLCTCLVFDCGCLQQDGAMQTQEALDLFAEGDKTQGLSPRLVGLLEFMSDPKVRAQPDGRILVLYGSSSSLAESDVAEVVRLLSACNM